MAKNFGKIIFTFTPFAPSEYAPAISALFACIDVQAEL